ncbi:MAG TPA: ferrous iron transport protein B, partial [Saprospiraceae bacterium]|nr:ferrous iron transport protein B [Saprospiraceae bacterium]
MGKKSNKYRVALIGNPNCGKTSLFNSLTGMHQHVANFPGVTVDKKTGILKLDKTQSIELIDFPGTYSLYPNSDDERVVAEILTNPNDKDYPDAIIYIIDPFDLKRQMLLLTQLQDIGIPLLVVLTMEDLAQKQGLNINIKKLSNQIQIPVIFFSNKTKKNIDEIKTEIKNLFNQSQNKKTCYNLIPIEREIVDHFRNKLKFESDYQGLLQIHHSDWLKYIRKELKKEIKEYKLEIGFNDISLQIQETLERYRIFNKKIKGCIKYNKNSIKTITDKIDDVITHKIFGPIIFFVLMLFMFQAIFSWSELPMEWLEDGFTMLSNYIKINFPQNWLTGLLADGIIPGLAGVLVFIPQIFLLFLIIGIMEEIGYMSRVIFMFDDLMRKFGMNGRSMISLISGGACAVPAIMSTRTINNWKERLITIMVTPLISCSARIPVYTLLVVFAVPDKDIGIFNTRGLALMGLYLMGIVMALISSLVMKYILKSRGNSYLMISLPEYKRPILKNVGLYVKEKVGAFVFGAGKIILMVSIVLWFLASYGPPGAVKQAEIDANKSAISQNLNKNQTDKLLASEKIEHSYIGYLGQAIEPAIKPLGFDWKIGIALITSFAAREIFVGTMATIYSVGSTEDNLKVSEQMAKDVNLQTGEKTYNSAVAW